MKRPRVQGVYRVQAFAELAGVTVRALHHYDRLALLKPRRTASGYRLYSPPDLERVEQIVALKFLGLSLKQIKTVLGRDSRSLVDVLRAQRRALEDKRRRLDKAIGAIGSVERAIQPGRPADASVLRRIIEVIEMSDQKDEMKKYYNDAAWLELSRRREQMTERLREIAMEGTRKWQALFADVTASLDADPAGPVAQALADRWKTLIEEFTGGNQDIKEGIGRAWKDRDNWSDAMRAQSTEFADPRVWEFIKSACAARQG